MSINVYLSWIKSGKREGIGQPVVCCCLAADCTLFCYIIGSDVFFYLPTKIGVRLWLFCIRY